MKNSVAINGKITFRSVSAFHNAVSNDKQLADLYAKRMNLMLHVKYYLREENGSVTAVAVYEFPHHIKHIETLIDFRLNQLKQAFIE